MILKKFHDQKLHTALKRAVSFTSLSEGITAACPRRNRKTPLDLITSPRASIAVEASIVISIFLFVMSAFISFLRVLETQQTLQMALDNTAKTIAREFYYKDTLKDVKQVSDALSQIESFAQEKGKNDSVDDADGSVSPQIGDKDQSTESDREISGQSDPETLTGAGNAAFKAYVYAKFLSEIGTGTIKDLPVRGGVTGLDFSKSVCDADKGTLDLVLRYRFYMPYFAGNLMTLKDCLSAGVTEWTGRDITQSEDIVYITKNGRVYHTSLECTHLNIKIQKALYKDLETLRNASGGKYEKCRYCGNKKNAGGVIYITPYGESYHTSLSCGGLRRSVMAVERDRVGDRTPCKDCAGKSEDES